nr:BBSome-interacting protein 1 isoform X1 [Taeniopygia guttata]
MPEGTGALREVLPKATVGGGHGRPGAVQAQDPAPQVGVAGEAGKAAEGGAGGGPAARGGPAAARGGCAGPAVAGGPCPGRSEVPLGTGPEGGRWCRPGGEAARRALLGEKLRRSLPWRCFKREFREPEPLGKREEASSTPPCSKPGLPDPLEH